MLDPSWARTEGLEVSVNGYVVALARPETVIQVPAGPMHLDLRGARAELLLGEDEVAQVTATAPRQGLPAGRLQVAGQAV